MMHLRMKRLKQASIGEAGWGERGSALLIALILIVVLTFIGLGLLTRSLMVTRIAGSERWSTKAFYGADSGLQVAKARLRIRRTGQFNFTVNDLRGKTGALLAGTINVAVSNMANVGAPRPVAGTQVGGGQGSSEPLYMFFFQGTSTATQRLTRSKRVVTATMGAGPMPLMIPK